MALFEIDPATILARMTDAIPGGAQLDMQTLMQFGPYVTALASRQPPAGMDRLIEPIAAGHGIPHLLILSMAAQLSHFDPEYYRIPGGATATAARVGLLAVPGRVWRRVRSDPAWIVYDPDAPDDINPIKMNILLTAQWLRRYADRDGSDLAGAVMEWCRPAGPDPLPLVDGSAGRVVADYLYRFVASNMAED